MTQRFRIRRACAIASAALVVTLVAGALVAALLERGRVAAAQRDAARLVAEQAGALQRLVYRSLAATDAIAAVVRHAGGDVEAFEATARDLLPHFPGVSALQLAPGGVVRHSVPLAGNEAAIGHDLLVDPKRNREAVLALQTRRLTLAGPFDLMQGGAAIVGRLPVFVGSGPGIFWGFSTAIMRVDDLASASRLSELGERGYDYALSRPHPDSQATHVFVSSRGAVPAEPVSQSFEIPNGRWTLSAAPVGGWSSRDALARDAVVVLLVAFAVAALAYSLARRPERLEAEVAERTRAMQDTLVELASSNARLGREIDGHRRTQSDLARSEERLRALVEATSDWVWEVDENAVYTYASPKVRDLLGYEPHEVIGRTPFDLMAPGEAERIGGVFARIAAARQPFAMLENVNRHKDGRDVVLETSGVPVFDEQGGFRGYRGIDRDVTQRKRTEERIRKLSRAVDQTANAIMITDVNGRIEYVNPKFCEMTGYPAEEVLGANPRFLKSGEQPQEVYAEMWQAIRAGGSWLGEFHNRRRSGELFWCLQSVSAIRGERGEVTHFVSVMEDISNRKLADATIRHLAYYDSLTGLPNRRLFMDRLEQAVAGRDADAAPLALVYLDVDRMNNVNDSLGRAAGDALLRAIGERLTQTVRRDDTVARLEGDEFAVMIGGVRDTRDAARIVDELAGALRRPTPVHGHELFATVSIGVALYPQDAASVDELVRNADTALNLAKRDGDGFAFFTADMNARVAEYLTLETRLRRAVERDEFGVDLQPRVEVATGRVTGAEALVRWRHPELGTVLPGQFIRLAEETGLVVPIGERVLREACRIGSSWPAALARARVSVNLSARQFRQGRELCALVRDVLAQTRLAPERLELEITESVLMERPDDAVATMRELASLGLTLAIDDFGTGYSSLSYLKHLPVKTLKIDQSFIAGLPHDAEDLAIVTAVVALARALGLSVVAEGVETNEQLACLRRLGCNEIQGYLACRPVEPAEFLRRLERGGLSDPHDGGGALPGSVTPLRRGA